MIDPDRAAIAEKYAVSKIDETQTQAEQIFQPRNSPSLKRHARQTPNLADEFQSLNAGRLKSQDGGTTIMLFHGIADLAHALDR